MGCSSCAEKARRRRLEQQANALKDGVISTPRVYASSNIKNTPAKVVEASDTTEKVLLRYYGGGSGTTRVRGCRACGGSKVKYTQVTSERIMFASDEAPNGFFNLLVSVGHDYLVTRAQADYMLTLTYKNSAGRLVHKFKEV